MLNKNRDGGNMLNRNSDEKKAKTKELSGSILTADMVGFSAIKEQLRRKATRKGFRFTLMIVGEPGVGKSTFMNTLFATDIYPNKGLPKIVQTLQIETKVFKLEENGVAVDLTVVDTPGFGANIDNSKALKPILEYIEEGHKKLLETELSLNYQKEDKNLVDACLYFVAPTGHGLKELDIEFMKMLSEKVNIVPVIAKADAFLAEELGLFKQNILRQILENGIQVYDFPRNGLRNEVVWRKKHPFAVVGSNTIALDKNGKKVRGRKYPWGTVDVENENHSDLVALKSLLFGGHLFHLQCITHRIIHENFREAALLSLTSRGNSKVNEEIVMNPYVRLEEEKKNHDKKMNENAKDMEEVFSRKVHEKEERLVRLKMQEISFIEKEQENMVKEKEMIEFEREQLRKDKESWEKERGEKLTKVNTLPAGGFALAKTRPRFGLSFGNFTSLGFRNLQNRD